MIAKGLDRVLELRDQDSPIHEKESSLKRSLHLKKVRKHFTRKNDKDYVNKASQRIELRRNLKDNEEI